MARAARQPNAPRRRGRRAPQRRGWPDGVRAGRDPPAGIPGELPTIARSPSHSGPETEDGALLGTLAYMSPEQARGEPATPASDLYSFGLLLQELYTGRPPYPETGDAAALLDHARRGNVPPPAGLDADLTRLIQRLKAPRPPSGRRPSTRSRG